MFNQLSLRYKLPIAFSVVTVVTALMISAVLSWHSYGQMHDDLTASAAGISRSLARTLAPLMQHDDVWQAYESVITPLTLAAREQPGQKLVIVLDAQQRIFVSSQPKAFPMQRRLDEVDASYASVLQHLSRADVVTWHEESGEVVDHIFSATPILAADGHFLGSVVVRFDNSLFMDRFTQARNQVVLTTLVTIAWLLPLGWAFSRTLTEPLVALRERMAVLPGFSLPARQRAGRWWHGDEIGELSQQFDMLHAELEKHERLKTQMASADRMAALGRLAAGIAHEINNPLGGMINAADTFERYGNGDALAMRTISLLKRGLAQIRETVGAMLVEARLESRAFTPQDVEDLRTLAEADQRSRGTFVVWHSDLPGPLPLPATPLRQLILNLLLNALAASPEGGTVECHLRCGDGRLEILVQNTGRMIPPERLLKLFEPYESADASGNGLGLWVCYQIVQQLKGEIEANSEDSLTSMTVRLPLASAHAAQDMQHQMKETVTATT